jgi:hypothetical protein
MVRDNEGPVTRWLGIHESNVKIPPSAHYETMKGRTHVRPSILTTRAVNRRAFHHQCES